MSKGAAATRPRLALFDLDGTITVRDTYAAYLAGYFLRHPVRWPAAPALVAAVLQFRSGRRDNIWLKERFLVRVLGGATRGEIRQWNRKFLPRLVASGLRSGARRQIELHRGRGDRLVLLTASLDLYVEDLARRLGLGEVLCTRAEWRDGRLTGRLAGANVKGVEKVRRIADLLGTEREGWHVTAYGDHHSDLPLLRWADRGIVVCPDPVLARAAADAGLEIVRW